MWSGASPVIPVDQTEYGPFGNCFAACVASLLEVPIEEVPNFMLGLPTWDPEDPGARSDWSRAFFAGVNNWLAPRGLFYFEISTPGGIPSCVAEAIHLSALWVGAGEVDGGTHHAVVMHGPRMVHDPHPRRAGVTQVDTIGLLVPLDPARLAAEHSQP